MMLGKAWVSIANEALALLGKDPLQSLDDEGRVAMICRINTPIAVETVLSERPWKTAQKEATLAPLASSTDEYEGLIYEYQIPSDLIRIVDVYAPVWRRIGDRIRSPRAPLILRYVSMPDQPSALGRMLTEAMVYLLASKLAVPVSADSSAFSNFFALYQNAVTKASIQESAGERDDVPPSSSLYGDFRKLSVSGAEASGFDLDMRTYLRPYVSADDIPEDTNSGTV